ncbi:MAG: ATP-binding protein [Pseudomonadota bacterium]|nr:ATP-binding protein [Pseudomonadota bacterium]
MTTATEDIARLRLEVSLLPPSTTIDQAADLFLSPGHARMLCLPVVDAFGRVLGTISRHTLNGIFLTRYGRSLHGNKSITTVMNCAPLIVDQQTPLERAAAYVTAKLGSPITEDFVVVDGERYAGMGIVLDLLSALQQRVESNSRQLQTAYGQLQASQAQLVQSEKMASLGQMVAGVAHEINTPLGYVRNNVEMIQGVFGLTAAALSEHHRLLQLMTDDGTDEAKLSEAMNACAQSIDAIGDMGVINDTESLLTDTLFGVDTIKDLVINLRNFSRLDQARTAEVSINDCLDQTLTIANNVLKSKVEIIKRYGDVPKLRCSPSQINQVLLNMMTNAAQAIEHDQGKLLLKTEFDGSFVRIHIQDNGKGIPKDQLDRIFDPFFTTKPVGHGTGLGLSISFQIIQAHGGAIQVVSEPGRGTKFVISLPLRAAEALAA